MDNKNTNNVKNNKTKNKNYAVQNKKSADIDIDEEILRSVEAMSAPVYSKDFKGNNENDGLDGANDRMNAADGADNAETGGNNRADAAHSSSDIRLNKKLRQWNKYKKYVYTLGGIAVAAIVVVAGAKIIGGLNKGDNGAATTAQKQTTAKQETTAAIADNNTVGTETQAQQTTVADADKPYNRIFTTDKKVDSEDFSYKDYYANSVFVGDMIISGIEHYGYLDSSQVISDDNVTTDKATKFVDQIVSANPDKVFIMLGLNDLNYGTDIRSTDKITQYYKDLIHEIQDKLPNTKIHIVSVLPISKSYEDKSTVKISNNNIKELNKKLVQMVATDGVSYIDLYNAFTDGSGNLDSELTSNGVALYNSCYGFMLNTIAEITNIDAK